MNLEERIQMSYFDYESDVLNVTELAEYLKIGLSTAYSLINNNEIPSFRVKKSYRILRSDVTDFIIKQRKKETS